MKNLYYSFIMASLLFSRHFIISGQPNNVFYMMMSIPDYLITYGIFVLVILVLWSLLFMVEKSFPAHHPRIVSAALLIALLPLLDYVFFIIGFQPGMTGLKRIIYPAACLLYVPLIVLISFRIRLEKVILKLTPFLLGVSLLVAYYALPKAAATPVIEGGFTARQAPPAYLILFDEMSYEVLFDSTLKAGLPNITGFAEQAYVFHNAFSPGGHTLESIPKLLTGLDYEFYQEKNLDFYIQRSGGEAMIPLPLEGNIFHLAQKAGYNTSLVGGYMPYCDLFGAYLNRGRQYRSRLLFKALPPWPYSKVIYLDRFNKTIFYNMFDDFITGIKDAPDNTFHFVHFLIPHWPYIFDADGPAHCYWQVLIKGQRYDSERRYYQQFRFADAEFGKILEAIQESGNFDESLIILTTDHNHQTAADKRKIPLFIKAPFQSQTTAVEEESRTIYMVDFLAEFFRTGNAQIERLFHPDDDSVSGAFPQSVNKLDSLNTTRLNESLQ